MQPLQLDWKLVKFYDQEKIELYNLNKDSSEQKGLAKKNSAKAKELKNKLLAWQKQMNAKLPEPNPNYKNWV